MFETFVNCFISCTKYIFMIMIELCKVQLVNMWISKTAIHNLIEAIQPVNDSTALQKQTELQEMNP